MINPVGLAVSRRTKLTSTFSARNRRITISPSASAPTLPRNTARWPSLARPTATLLSAPATVHWNREAAASGVGGSAMNTASASPTVTNSAGVWLARPAGPATCLGSVTSSGTLGSDPKFVGGLVRRHRRGWRPGFPCLYLPAQVQAPPQHAEDERVDRVLARDLVRLRECQVGADEQGEGDPEARHGGEPLAEIDIARTIGCLRYAAAPRRVDRRGHRQDVGEVVRHRDDRHNPGDDAGREEVQDQRERRHDADDVERGPGPGVYPAQEAGRRKHPVARQRVDQPRADRDVRDQRRKERDERDNGHQVADKAAEVVFEDEDDRRVVAVERSIHAGRNRHREYGENEEAAHG